MQDQQDMVVRVLTTIAGPAVPPVYKLFMAPWPWAPFLTAFFTPPFFKVYAEYDLPLFDQNNGGVRYVSAHFFSLPGRFRQERDVVLGDSSNDLARRLRHVQR